MAEVNRAVVGRGLFGRRVRLDVALWASHHRTFFQKEAAEGIAYSVSAVREELERLASLGMLNKIILPGDRRVYYTRSESPLWSIIEATERALRELGERDAVL